MLIKFCFHFKGDQTVLWKFKSNFRLRDLFKTHGQVSQKRMSHGFISPYLNTMNPFYGSWCHTLEVLEVGTKGVPESVFQRLKACEFWKRCSLVMGCYFAFLKWWESGLEGRWKHWNIGVVPGSAWKVGINFLCLLLLGCLGLVKPMSISCHLGFQDVWNFISKHGQMIGIQYV